MSSGFSPLLGVLEIQSVGNHTLKDTDMAHLAKVTCTVVFRVPGGTHKTTWAEIAYTRLSNLMGIFIKRSSGGVVKYQTPS